MRDPFDWLLLVLSLFVVFVWFITAPVKAEEAPAQRMEDITYCWASHYNLYLPCMYSEKAVDA